MTSLTEMLNRARAALDDTQELIYDETTLTEAVRQALGAYGLGSLTPPRLAGLDGAAETTLNPLHESLVVWGTAAYAALARAAGQAGLAHPATDPDALRRWASIHLDEFQARLVSLFPALGQAESEVARVSQFHRSASAPWQAWPEKAD